VLHVPYFLRLQIAGYLYEALKIRNAIFIVEEAHTVFAEFKKFIMRGNVIDLAIGIIIGGAFGKIIASFVNDILMPPIGMLLGKVNFTNLFVSLDGTKYPTLEAAKLAGAATINYGAFISVIIDFLIIAFVIFLIVRQINKLKEAADKKNTPSPAAPKTKGCPFCFTQVDLRAKRCPNCTSELK
jgi:large conductance mechanosensitive channel